MVPDPDPRPSTGAEESSIDVPAHGLDPLSATPPGLDTETIERLAEQRFGVTGSASPLGGERDQNFRIDSDSGRSFVFKVSNPADGPAVLDLQAEALRHVERQDPELPLMRSVPTRDGTAWASVDTDDGTPCLVRMFTVVPGRSLAAEQLDHAALHDYGAVVARMGRALRGFFHPAARYDILWDLRHTAQLRTLLGAVADQGRRSIATHVLDRFDERVGPAFDGLRAQVIHNDLTLDNVLHDDERRVSGIVDVGDLTHTALLCDLAVALAAVMWRRGDPLDTARAAIKGYVSIVPLDDGEAWLLADLVAARLVAWGTIAAWRSGHHPDNTEYITAGEDDAWDLLAALDDLGLDRVARSMHTAATGGPVAYRWIPTDRLAQRRRDTMRRSPLAYDEPLHLVAGEGVWLFDPAGHRYLDAYNNVAVVGHGNLGVAVAIAGQARTLATNSRYLHEAAVTLAQRLVDTMPAALDTVLFVNSGSEANDLAWQLATTATARRGAIVTDHAYHGMTEATAALSPETWPAGHRPGHVVTMMPPGLPGAGRGGRRTSALTVTDAVAVLRTGGIGLAAMLLDPACTSDGILVPGATELGHLANEVNSHGGLLVADEVQAGHGRYGTHLWSFAASGLEPDIVTLGKAMGNGHPVAAVVTRADIADALMDQVEVFSTFGGNPVSCAAALAVLDVLDAEGLMVRAVDVGEHLRAQLAALASTHRLIGAVRGRGMMTGVELVRGDEPGTAATAAAANIVNGMRRRGVLIGATGRHGNVLKIRPPLVFERDHADLLVETLDTALSDAERTEREVKR